MDFMANSDMINIWTNVSESVNKRLENDIINVLAKYTDNYFDILEAINKLEAHGVFSQEYCHQLLRKFSNLHLSKREQLSVFILDIVKEASPVEFYDILDLIDLSDMAEEIHCEHNGPVHRQIRRAPIPHSHHLQKHFYVLKSYLDDNVFTDRRNFLRDNTNELKSSFPNLENENVLTKAANKFAVNTWLWVQHCKRDTHEIRNILMDMRALSWPAGVDPILSEVIFESKMAVVSAMEGSFECSKGHRRNAKYLVREYHDPLTKSLVCHDSRYVSQILARNNVADTTSVLRECQIGLRFLESETNGNHFCKQMQRSFLLYLAQHYLRIGNDLHIDRTVPIPAKDLQDAENVLYVVRINLQSGQIVERRRDMVYNVCMARLFDAHGQRQTAIAYLCEAQHLSRNGAFFEGEIRNIGDYKAVLERL
ncbi:uncharacterized protein LOC128546983 [Mercenaria mercenaria]|uniref:uncharacterized protein LOC128546983 n=1 Tax=Mercenaria mercenaria TaxID=6596 RepID=UPI00234E4501|nr:uncharacterized protein LOC128546983 [Mercenaria mercenaria]